MSDCISLNADFYFFGSQPQNFSSHDRFGQKAKILLNINLRRRMNCPVVISRYNVKDEDNNIGTKMASVVGYDKIKLETVTSNMDIYC